MTTPLWLRRFPGAGRVLRALGVTGVPTAGFFAAQWTLGTMLLLYWIETILTIVVVAILVTTHWRKTRKAGHRRSDAGLVLEEERKARPARKPNPFLDGYLGVMVPFTLGHGVFVAAFAFLVFPARMGEAAAVSPVALRDGAVGIAICLLAGLLLDLRGLAERPFSWVRRAAERSQGRMIVTHLVIIFGGMAMAAFDAPVAFFALFVGLKALFELPALLPEPDDETVPGWVTRVGARLPVRNGRRFDEMVAGRLAERRRAREAAEEAVPPAAP